MECKRLIAHHIPSMSVHMYARVHAPCSNQPELPGETVRPLKAYMQRLNLDRPAPRPRRKSPSRRPAKAKPAAAVDKSLGKRRRGHGQADDDACELPEVVPNRGGCVCACLVYGRARVFICSCSYSCSGGLAVHLGAEWASVGGACMI
jgi:hypothetical protein